MDAAQIRNALQKEAKNYNSSLTALGDYAFGLGAGAIGQQVLNWTTDGADPMPLVSGLLGAPINRAASQLARAGSLGFAREAFNLDPRGVNPNNPELIKRLMIDGGKAGAYKFIQDAPIEAALGGASLLGAGTTGAATSIYNVTTGGQDIDNNLTSSIGGLAALAPIAYMLMKKRQQANQTVPF